MKFAVCGEALFDVFATAHTPTGLALDARMGGSPFNVAVGLARLGQAVGLVTAMSDGFLGERLMSALREEQVDTRLIQRSAAHATLSLVGLDAAGVPSYAFYGEQGADRLLDESVLNAWPNEVACVHLGSYAAVMGQTARTQRAIIEQAASAAVISYDPNVRLNVQPDKGVWREQLEWMLPRTHLLKVSEEDLDLLFPGQAAAEFAERALRAGVAMVVVTRGAHGAEGWTAQGHAQVPPVAVVVVDTVGAGDTFQAALLTWMAEQGLLHPEALRDCPPPLLAMGLAFAARAAAVTCSRRGADLPRRAELVA